MNKGFRRIVTVLLVLAILIAYPAATYAFSVYSTATIGILTIFSVNDGGSSSWNRSGHAWISFKNFTHPPVEFGGLNVATNSEVTIGTFGNLEYYHVGIWYNLESYLVNQLNQMSGRVSLSMAITRSELDTINSLIDENDEWAVLNNCSSFAVKIWNAVSEDKLSAGSPNTPTSLISSIKSYDYYENNRTIVYNSTIGYVEDGIYYSENPYELETDMVDFAVSNNIPLFG